MYARVLRIKGSPDKVDAGTDNFKSQALPTVKEQDGYAGSRLLLDRRTGEGMIVTFWRDEATLRASEEALRSLRSEASAKFGTETPKPEHFEAAVQHRPQPTEKGNWVRISSLSGDPAKVDEGIRHFESQVVPSIEGLPGFRAAVLLVDRGSGAALGITVWNSKADLDGSAQAAGPIRAAAAQVTGATNPTVEAFEVEFAEMLAPVAT
jgi:heme-degrading monooxygenase HmoA